MKSKEEKWFYTEIVKEHFFNPRNMLKSDKESEEFAKSADGEGQVGNPVCGDIMKFWIKVDKKADKIVDCRWQTMGCASAIASASMMSEMVKENGGMAIEKALKLTPQDIVERLKGLPARKIHCSVLGHNALKAAVNDYFRKSNQVHRITEKGESMKKKTSDDAKIKSEVEDVLIEIRSALQADGGDVQLVKIKDGIVTLKLTGACSCCPFASQTMKNFVEKKIKEKVKGVKEVVAGD